MKTKLLLIFAFLMLFSSFENLNAQKTWNKLDKQNLSIQENEIYLKKNFPAKYELFSLDIAVFKKELNSKSKTSKQIIELPNSKGGLSKFKIKETSNFDEKLAAKFPMIKSYSAQGIDDPTAVAKISVGTDGFHAVIFSGNNETMYIDPYSKNNKNFISYKRGSLKNSLDDEFTCQVEEFTKKVIVSDSNNKNRRKNANDGKLRTFRLALACSAEYADFHLTRQNVSVTVDDAVKKAAVLSAMNTSITRVNGVYERDLSVRMVLVGDNDKIVFLDTNTDGVTDINQQGIAGTIINEVQVICDNEIGDANYDIGHIFTINGDGLAGGGVVCISGQKARGVTGRAQPVNDPFDIDYVAHEMGHQFGANHTQNNDCNRNNSTAVEPGSASTIMGYAGICSPNVQNNSDDHFHAVNIAEMWNTIQSSATCGVLTDTNNSAPTANAGLDYSIPKSTPFVLKGTATDADGIEGLTYNWEQIDNQVASMPPSSTNIAGPMFRSLPSKTLSNRYMPDLATVISGNTSSTWEVVPSVARELNFSFLVRDNNAGGGSTARDDMQVTVTDAEAFTVSLPNSAVTWDVGSTQTITWNKSTTDVAPINCQNVNIKLSIDGGLTFPITILSNTPNDGTEDIIIPNNTTTSARIMVEAADNIFYNVNSTNFVINSTIPTFIMNNTSGVQSACNVGNQSASYTLNFDFVNGFSETVSFVTSGQPTGSSVSFNPTTINEDGNIIMTVSNLNGVTPQEYTIKVDGNSNTVNQSTDVVLNVTNSNFGTLALTSPTNNATDVSLTDELKWVTDTNASSYEVQLSSDSNFSTLVISTNVTTNFLTLTNLSSNTQYYWRVKPKNSCGEGTFSNVFSFTTFQPSYCPSTFTDDVIGKEHITNVAFNTINNNSGNDAVDGYEDFTSINTNVKRGDSHQISVTINTGGFQDHCYVFIDWNQDFIFDNNTERYDLGVEFEDVGTRSFNITVPNNANFGSTRMRVIIEYYGGAGDFGEGACDVDQKEEWGETEDYTVIVDNTASLEDVAFNGFNLYPNPTKGAFTLNLEVVNTDKVSVELFDVRGRLIAVKEYLNTKTNFSENIFFEKASAGLYLLKVTNGQKQTTRKLIIK